MKVVEMSTKGKEQGARGKEQGARSKGQGARSKGQGARRKEKGKWCALLNFNISAVDLNYLEFSERETF